MLIQWYPGHMTKAKRAMQEDIKLVDLIIELLDARIPLSSRNPDIDTLAKGKFRMVLLNKADLADPAATEEWIDYFKSQGITAIALDSRAKTKMREIQNKMLDVCKEKIERDKRRGIQNRPIRAMVVGIPNVGKSTFINSFSGKSAAKTGNKPGVTRGNQWIRLNKNAELLDTPGILWPKFDDETVGTHLAYIGSVSDDVVDSEELGYEFIKEFINTGRTDILKERYSTDPEEFREEDRDFVLSVMEGIALKRNCLKKGGEADTLKFSKILMDDFRTGRLGQLTIEMP